MPLRTLGPDLSALREALAEADTASNAALTLQRLVRAGLGGLPLPGSGSTLRRWQALALVAQHDLSLAKLYEGHTDALAIIAELGAAAGEAPDSPFTESETWGVWAAEGPGARVAIVRRSDSREVLVDGTKHWCSGAGHLSHGLLTAWDDGASAPQLISVAMNQPGVEVDASAWQAVGMAGSSSVDVIFRGARGRLVGAAGDYLRRPGFWQGGAGIAACWYGGSLRIAKALRDAAARTPQGTTSPFRLAALGQVDVHLQTTAALLRETAQWIDAHPRADAQRAALRARLAAERAATAVLAEAGRALGATPFCRDRGFARAAADLPVFVRQSHAERDFAALADTLLRSGETPGDGAWML